MATREEPDTGRSVYHREQGKQSIGVYWRRENTGYLPVATGKTAELTPEGLFNVTVKAKDPYYRKKNIPGGDPRNPLGTRWIGFDAEGTDGRIYGIHGTNRPSSIGRYISNGCIRMQNKNVEYLFDKAPVGTKVLVVKTKKSFNQLGKEYGAI